MKNGEHEEAIGDDVFKGMFVDDKKHGFGTYEYANGDEYSGDWVDNLKQGKGVFKYADGSYFKGEFSED